MISGLPNVPISKIRSEIVDSLATVVPRDAVIHVQVLPPLLQYMNLSKFVTEQQHKLDQLHVLHQLGKHKKATKILRRYKCSCLGCSCFPRFVSKSLTLGYCFC